MIDSDHPDRDEPIPGAGAPLLYQTIYCSRATAGVDDAAVARIIRSSQRQNPVRGITGLLVFGSGVFFQWIEGPRESVARLMSVLRTDVRHEHIVALTESEEIGERLFPDWSMELVTADDIRDVLRDARDTADDPRNVEALGRILEQLESGSLAELGRA